jgi:hypothetical protein
MKKIKHGITPAELEERVKTLYKRLGTWRAVAAEIGLSEGTTYRIGVYGEMPKVKKNRIKAGLDVFEPAPVCRTCGSVHVYTRCTRPRTLPEPWEGAVQWLRERERATHG